MLRLVECSLRILGFARTCRLIATISQPNENRIVRSKLARVRGIRREVSKAALLPPSSDRDCLRRSLVLLYRLRRINVEADLRTGVKRKEGSFAFHAWLELDGIVLNDDLNEVATYQVIDIPKLYVADERQNG